MNLILLFLTLIAPQSGADELLTSPNPNAQVSNSDSGALLVAGPDTAASGEIVRLRLEGLPTFELKKTMEEQLKWIESVNIIIDAPKGTSEGEYSLDKTLTIKVAPFAWAFNLDFKANKPGDYLIIVDWNLGPYELCVHRITVGGTPVVVVPPGPVGPVVDPTKAVSAVLLIETDELSPQHGILINQIRNKIATERLLILDQHLSAAEKAVKYCKEKNIQLPALLGIDGNKVIVVTESLGSQSSVDSILKTLEKWGIPLTEVKP